MTGGASRAELRSDLTSLGLPADAVVMVHASLRAVRPAARSAAEVAAALLDVIGATGTLVVPTQTTWNSTSSAHYTAETAGMTADEILAYRFSLPGFDAASTPSSRMGLLAEYVRTLPGAVRSSHPQCSFSAFGPRATHLMLIHDLDCHLGERSPLGALYRENALVLHLGTGFDVCTAFHLAEYRHAALPTRHYECRIAESAASAVATDARGWTSFEDIHLDDSDFSRLGAAFAEQPDSVRFGTVGSAQSMLFPVRAAVDFAVTWMRRERRAYTERASRDTRRPSQ